MFESNEKLQASNSPIFGRVGELMDMLNETTMLLDELNKRVEPALSTSAEKTSDALVSRTVNVPQASQMSRLSGNLEDAINAVYGMRASIRIMLQRLEL